MKQQLLDVILAELSIHFHDFVRDISSDPINMQDLLDCGIVIKTLLRQIRNADLGEERERVLRVLMAMRNSKSANYSVHTKLMETIRVVQGD